MNTSADLYFIDGCGRCSLGGTPDCKVNDWQEELIALRNLLLDCGLVEECKWGVPCYTIQNKNVILLSAFKVFCSISFLKGSLLADEAGLLVKAGPNSHVARLYKVSGMDDILGKEDLIKAYIFEAIEVEKAGLEVQVEKVPESIPEELEARFEEDPVFKSAFESLTPGRQRGYLIHFAQPKKSETRSARIEKYTEQIMRGEGMHDAYQAKRKRPNS